MTPIEAGKEALEAILQPLREEKRRLAERIAEIDVTLVPLEEAISPLGGKSRGKKKAASKPAPRTVNQEDVRQVLTRLLANKPAAPRQSLLAAAKKTLKVELGLDLKGFANRCREVLAQAPFQVDEAGSVSLCSNASGAPPTGEAASRHRDPKTAVDNSAAGALGR